MGDNLKVSRWAFLVCFAGPVACRSDVLLPAGSEESSESSTATHPGSDPGTHESDSSMSTGNSTPADNTEGEASETDDETGAQTHSNASDHDENETGDHSDSGGDDEDTVADDMNDDSGADDESNGDDETGAEEDTGSGETGADDQTGDDDDPCIEGRIQCDAECIDPLSDERFCGADETCRGGIECPDAHSCHAGACVAHPLEWHDAEIIVDPFEGYAAAPPNLAYDELGNGLATWSDSSGVYWMLASPDGQWQDPQRISSESPTWPSMWFAQSGPGRASHALWRHEEELMWSEAYMPDTPGSAVVWSTPKPIAAGIHDQTFIRFAAPPDRGAILVRHDRTGGHGQEGELTAIEFSPRGGYRTLEWTWNADDIPPGRIAIDVARDGGALVLWPTRSGLEGRYRSFAESRWSEFDITDIEREPDTPVAIHAAPGDGSYVAWVGTRGSIGVQRGSNAGVQWSKPDWIATSQAVSYLDLSVLDHNRHIFLAYSVREGSDAGTKGMYLAQKRAWKDDWQIQTYPCPPRGLFQTPFAPIAIDDEFILFSWTQSSPGPNSRAQYGYAWSEIRMDRQQCDDPRSSVSLPADFAIRTKMSTEGRVAEPELGSLLYVHGAGSVIPGQGSLRRYTLRRRTEF